MNIEKIILSFFKNFFTLKPKPPKPPQPTYHIVYPPYDWTPDQPAQIWNWLQEEKTYHNYQKAILVTQYINQLNKKEVAIIVTESKNEDC